ncbi:MAG: response regulator transcription factor [Alistipes sp.]|nr:response regulator transcription factor [Alistipes sp.]
MQRGKIIIYSPKPLLAEMVADIIGYAEGEIMLCSSTQQVVELCESIRADLVIILSSAPLRNGKGLIQRLRRGHRIPAIYVISWHHNEQTVLSLLECGVDQYMTFPVCMERLKIKSSREHNNKWES